jgi:hypothetical protein
VRIEIYRHYCMTMAVLLVCFGIFMTVMFVSGFVFEKTLGGRAIWAFFTAFALSTTIFAAATPWLRKRSKTRPLIIIDDAGLWLRKVGEVMPWSEIKSVDLWTSNTNNAGVDTLVVWRHQRYSIAGHGQLPLMALWVIDRDGELWRPVSVFKEIKARWERNSVGSGKQSKATPGTTVPTINWAQLPTDPETTFIKWFIVSVQFLIAVGFVAVLLLSVFIRLRGLH